MISRRASAAEFEAAARRNARFCFIWAVNAALLAWLTSIWWATLPAGLAAWGALGFISCSVRARRLRSSTSQNGPAT